jgi:hypothetical protein
MIHVIVFQYGNLLTEINIRCHRFVTGCLALNCALFKNLKAICCLKDISFNRFLKTSLSWLSFLIFLILYPLQIGL